MQRRCRPHPGSDSRRLGRRRKSDAVHGCNRHDRARTRDLRAIRQLLADRDGDDKPFADKLNAIPKIVFSKTLDRAPWGSWDEATISDDGWCRTGDVGHVDADGFVQIVDRLKELIKYKGYQVAPAELEAVLISHPLIADAAVVASPDEEAGEVPKAFLVLNEATDREDVAREVMAYVAERVAPYKRVRRYEFVEAIPRTPSGKIVRRGLIERERLAVHAMHG